MDIYSIGISWGVPWCSGVSPHRQYTRLTYSFAICQKWYHATFSVTSLVVRRAICRKLGTYKLCKLYHAFPHPCSSFLWDYHSLGWLKMEHLQNCMYVCMYVCIYLRICPINLSLGSVRRTISLIFHPLKKDFY